MSDLARGRLERVGRLRIVLSVRFAGVSDPRTLRLTLRRAK
jgi:hypothetical protein